jgi:hypothetical protein
MTPSKLWYAQKLATLRNDGTKPEDLAEQMTIRRLCYEIEKLEEELEAAKEPEPEPEAKSEPEEKAEPEPAKAEPAKARGFWSRLVLDSSSDEE